MDNFLLEAHKKIVSSEIKQRNKERQADRKKLSKAEQASLNQNQESDTRCSTSEKIPEEFLTQVSVIVQDGKGKIGEKKAKGIIYNKMLEHLSILQKQRSEETGLHLPEIFRKNLQRKTQKAVKIYKLFEKVGKDNIKYITTYSANSISELTNNKVQDIIDNFSKHNDNNNSDVEEVSSHITEISAGSSGQNHVTKNPETRERIINVPPALESTERM
ncbi:hypothetical protein RhiirA1_479855 [Rhizophagus irregularis]|uniref:Uncharacterized protein n=1 Tax=Rhizophagus irregularis TaxID=588596 RepID=A0A2N0QQ53_9GLOM|nr:hypothetical protein RhiirA1_479855 [Rhizophagus irregularis]